MPRRDALALAIAPSAYMYWQGAKVPDLGLVIDGWLNGALQTLLITGVALCAAMATVAIAHSISRTKRWKRLAVHLLVPVRTIVVYLAVVIGPYLVLNSVIAALGKAAWFAHDEASFKNLVMIAFSVALAITLMAAVLYWMVAVLRLTLLAAKYRFRASDGHPTLLPLTIALVGVVALCQSVVRLLEAGPNPAYPTVVAVLLAVGGPVSVAGLAVWDLLELKRRGRFFSYVP